MYLDPPAAAFLRAKIKEEHFTQKDLAYILEVTPSVLSKQLRGEISIPRQRIEIILEKLITLTEEEEAKFTEMLDSIELREELSKQQTKPIGYIEPSLEALMNIWKLLSANTKKKILAIASESLISETKQEEK